MLLHLKSDFKKEGMVEHKSGTEQNVFLKKGQSNWKGLQSNRLLQVVQLSSIPTTFINIFRHASVSRTYPCP